MEYSTVNHLVMMFCVALRYDSFPESTRLQDPIGHGDGRSSQLEHVGNIFNVVNRDDVALGQGEAKVQCLRLGARFGGRDDDQPELRGGFEECSASKVSWSSCSRRSNTSRRSSG